MKKIDKLQIVCGSTIFIYMIELYVITIASTFSNWIVAVLFAIMGGISILLIHLKKYNIAKAEKELTFKRVVLCDSLFCFLGFAYLLFCIYVPDPFYGESPLDISQGMTIPFGAFIISAFFTIPTIYTNKKILGIK